MHSRTSLHKNNQTTILNSSRENHIYLFSHLCLLADNIIIEYMLIDEGNLYRKNHTSISINYRKSVCQLQVPKHTLSLTPLLTDNVTFSCSAIYLLFVERLDVLGLSRVLFWTWSTNNPSRLFLIFFSINKGGGGVFFFSNYSPCGRL